VRVPVVEQRTSGRDAAPQTAAISLEWWRAAFSQLSNQSFALASGETRREAGARCMRKVVRSSLNEASQTRRDVLLYVEDDDDNWDVAVLRLSANYELLRARSAEEACEVLKERRNDIELILMDIELRGSDLNGVELTKLLRGEPLPDKPVPAYARGLPLISKPIVFVTAHGAKYTRVQLILAGAEQVIPKPVDFESLQHAVSEITQERTPAGRIR
jgi:CheY-like chemotaxis protein